MGILVEGFGRAVESQELEAGAIAFLTIRPHTGVRQLLVMRVTEQDFPQDLVLALVSGPGLPKALPHCREAARENEYVSWPGSFLARPSLLPVPDDSAGGGALVIDGEGEAFVRVQDEGVSYVHLASGKVARPGVNRAYFSDWRLIHQYGGREQVAAKFTPQVIADLATMHLEPANPGVA